MRLLSIDPGKNTGAALGFYDDETPYTLLERWQVHRGVYGFMEWWDSVPSFDELVVEQFVLDSKNEFAADLTPVAIEGAIAVLTRASIRPTYQLRTAKADLVEYPPSATTKARRQRERFKFLDRFGLFVPGTEHDDSNDAITHALVYLRRQRHPATVNTFWPLRPLPEPTRLGNSF